MTPEGEEYSLLVVARYKPYHGSLTEAQRQMIEAMVKRNLEASMFEVDKAELVKESP